MDEIAVVSNRLIASLTLAEKMAHKRRHGEDVSVSVQKTRRLHRMLIQAMAESPQFVNEDLCAFAATVDSMLKRLEGTLACGHAQLH